MAEVINMSDRSKHPSSGLRPLYEIARDIRVHWPNMSLYAQPYWNAMQDLASIDDMYLHDSAESVVRYFLANAATWRGEHARRIKNELRKMIGDLK